MKNILAAFFCIFFFTTPFVIFSQTPTFQKVYSSSKNLGASSLLKTSRKNYLVSGNAIPAGSLSADSRDIFLMMIDSTGEVLWQKSHRHVRSFSKCIETPDGGFLMLGYLDNDDSKGALLLKTDSIGNAIWSQNWADKSPQDLLPLADGAVVSCIDSNVSRSFAMRINYDGDVLWSKMYDMRLALRYVEGDTIFGVGPLADLSIGQEGCLLKISSLTGIGYSSVKIFGNSQYDHFQQLTLARDGDFILSGYHGNQSTRRFWVVKIGRDGSVKWSKRFGMSLLYDLPAVLSVRATPDSGVVFAGYRSWPINPVLFKINLSGDLIWSRVYGPVGSGGFSDLLANQDGGFWAVGTTVLPDKNGILLKKTDAYGEVKGCCSQSYNLPSADYAVSVSSFTPVATDHFGLDTVIVEVFSESIETQDFCYPGFEPTHTQQEIKLCPGETVVIGGNSYATPAVVTDSLFNSIGCDSVVTYTLAALPYNTRTKTLELCPGDTIELGGNLYTQPGIVIDTLPSSGSCDTIVIYQLECAATPANPCDVKTNGCVTFELLRITQDAQSLKTYHIRVVNNCSDELIYTTFQIPTGVAANAPGNASIFTAPSGRTYEARNPNFSPFYSVRFKTSDVGIKNGQSDEFRYTLPPQSAPDYIYVLAKLETQNFVEAHLNTFNCPVETDGNNRPANRDETKILIVKQFNLFPNPSDGTFFVDFSGWEAEQIQIRVFNSQGQIVREWQVLTKEKPTLLDLPGTMSTGLYLIEARTIKGEIETKRFMLQR